MNYTLCTVLFEVVWMSCFVKLFFPRLMRNFSLKSVCLSLFLMGMNLCKKILMTVLAMAKAILFATACCFCCCADAQTNKPSNHQHQLFYSNPANFSAFRNEGIERVFHHCAVHDAYLVWFHHLQDFTTYRGAKTYKISVAQSEFETRSGEMLGMIYPPLRLFTISQFISPFKPA